MYDGGGELSIELRRQCTGGGNDGIDRAVVGADLSPATAGRDMELLLLSLLSITSDTVVQISRVIWISSGPAIP